MFIQFLNILHPAVSACKDTNGPFWLDVHVGFRIMQNSDVINANMEIQNPAKHFLESVIASAFCTDDGENILLGLTGRNCRVLGADVLGLGLL